MKMKRFIHILPFALALALAHTAYSQSDLGDRNSEVYKSFADHDRAAIANFTLDVQVARPKHPPALWMIAESQGLLTDMVITGRQNVIAAERRLNPDDPPPKFVEGLEDWNYDETGRLRVDREIQRVLLQEPGFRGIFRVKKVYTVTPDGEIEFQAESKGKILLHKPKGKYDSDESYLPILTSGRGYADLVDRFTEVKEVENGLLYCKGPGQWATGRPCDWELWIDPESSYLVRRVLCSIRDSGNNIQKHIRNSGTQGSGDAVIPKHGLFYSGPAEERQMAENDYRWWRLTFRKFENVADERLIEKAKTMTQGKYPRGASVMDFRKGIPPTTYTVR